MLTKEDLFYFDHFVKPLCSQMELASRGENSRTTADDFLLLSIPTVFLFGNAAIRVHCAVQLNLLVASHNKCLFFVQFQL